MEKNVGEMGLRACYTEVWQGFCGMKNLYILTCSNFDLAWLGLLSFTLNMLVKLYVENFFF